jgi:hypothetical protein
MSLSKILDFRPNGHCKIDSFYSDRVLTSSLDFFWAGWTSQIRLMMNGRKNNWEGIEKKDFLRSKQSCSIYLFNNGFNFVCLSSEIIVI